MQKLLDGLGVYVIIGFQEVGIIEFHSAEEEIALGSLFRPIGTDVGELARDQTGVELNFAVGSFFGRKLNKIVVELYKLNILYLEAYNFTSIIVAFIKINNILFFVDT